MVNTSGVRVEGKGVGGSGVFATVGNTTLEVGDGEIDGIGGNSVGLSCMACAVWVVRILNLS